MLEAGESKCLEVRSCQSMCRRKSLRVLWLSHDDALYTIDGYRKLSRKGQIRMRGGVSCRVFQVIVFFWLHPLGTFAPLRPTVVVTVRRMSTCCLVSHGSMVATHFVRLCFRFDYIRVFNQDRCVFNVLYASRELLLYVDGSTSRLMYVGG
jgi:hypothetical protein